MTGNKPIRKAQHWYICLVAMVVVTTLQSDVVLIVVAAGRHDNITAHLLLRVVVTGRHDNYITAP